MDKKMEFDPGKTYKIGEILKKAKLLTEEQLKTALEYQKSTGERLGMIIEKLGFVDETSMVKCLAEQQEIEIVNLDEMFLPVNLIKKIPRALIEKYTFLPVSLKDDELIVVISDPTDYEAIEQIQLVTDWRVDVVLAPRSVIKNHIKEIFEGKSKHLKSKEDLLDILEGKSKPKKKKITGTVGDSQLLPEALRDILISKQIITEEELTDRIKKIKKEK